MTKCNHRAKRHDAVRVDPKDVRLSGLELGAGGCCVSGTTAQCSDGVLWGGVTRVLFWGVVLERSTGAWH